MTSHEPDATDLPALWVTSSYSGGGNNCVQAAAIGTSRIAIRDSKVSQGPALLMSAEAWGSFVGGIRAEGAEVP